MKIKSIIKIIAISLVLPTVLMAANTFLLVPFESVGIDSTSSDVVTKLTLNNIASKGSNVIVYKNEVVPAVDKNAVPVVKSCYSYDCAKDQALKLGADYVITGNLSKLGSKTILIVSQHDAKTGEKKFIAKGNSESIETMDIVVANVVNGMFAKMNAPVAPAAPVAPVANVVAKKPVSVVTQPVPETLVPVKQTNVKTLESERFRFRAGLGIFAGLGSTFNEGGKDGLGGVRFKTFLGNSSVGVEVGVGMGFGMGVLYNDIELNTIRLFETKLSLPYILLGMGYARTLDEKVVDEDDYYNYYDNEVVFRGVGFNAGVGSLFLKNQFVKFALEAKIKYMYNLTDEEKDEFVVDSDYIEQILRVEVGLTLFLGK